MSSSLKIIDPFHIGISGYVIRAGTKVWVGFDLNAGIGKVSMDWTRRPELNAFPELGILRREPRGPN